MLGMQDFGLLLWLQHSASESPQYQMFSLCSYGGVRKDQLIKANPRTGVNCVMVISVPWSWLGSRRISRISDGQGPVGLVIVSSNKLCIYMNQLVDLPTVFYTLVFSSIRALGMQVSFIKLGPSDFAWIVMMIMMRIVMVIVAVTQSIFDFAWKWSWIVFSGYLWWWW